MATDENKVIDDKELEALLQQHRQARIDEIGRELAAWLDAHNAMLQTVSSFSPDGRLVTQIQVVLKGSGQ